MHLHRNHIHRKQCITYSNICNFLKVLLIYVQDVLIIKKLLNAPLMELWNIVWHEKSLGQRTVHSDPVWWSWRQRRSKEKSRCGSEVESLWGVWPGLFDVAHHGCCCTPVKMFFVWWQLETQSASLSQRNLHDPVWMRK